MKSLGFYYSLSNNPICPKINKECPIGKNARINDSNNGNKAKEDGNDKAKIKDDCTTNPECIQRPEVYEAEVHCNLWKIQQKKSKIGIYKNPIYDFYLDIGLKFSPQIRYLSLYFPFVITNDKISDLGQNIVQDQELCCLIFNEDVVTTHGQGCFSRVVFKKVNEDKESLWIYHIGETNYKCETAQEEHRGTILRINIDSDPKDELTSDKSPQDTTEFIYIRFRINLTDSDLENFKREELLSRDIIQSIFSKVELYDFRINDKREINKKIDEHLQNEGYRPFRMSKVHFFLVCDTRNNVEKASMPYSSRFIETDKWNSYLRRPVPQSMVAYQWKDQREKELIVNQDKEISIRESIKLSNLIGWERKSFSNFRLFVMLTYPQRSITQILFYCLLVILLGAIGSLIASLILKNIWINMIGIFLIGGTLLLWILLKNRSSVKFIQ